MDPLLVGLPGVPELLVIAGILVLLFGAKKVPELMRGMGEGVRELRRGVASPVDDKERKED